jgi:hypothetical protein
MKPLDLAFSKNKGWEMEPSERIVTRIPMGSLWDSTGPIRATRGRVLGTADIQALLRHGPVAIVIAEVAEPLNWVTSEKLYEIWKGELRPRLVEPEKGATKGFGFQLSDYPGGYCYIATEWSGAEVPVVLFEMHH